MTVFARGYRPYVGRRHPAAATRAIAAEGLRGALGRKAFRRIGGLYLGWFAMCCMLLYLAVVLGVPVFGMAPSAAGTAWPALHALDTCLLVFYTGVAVLTALLAIFVGAGLVADDLAAGALALYLVRPLCAAQYVAGKALVLAGILLVAVLLPGLFFWLLVALWQPTGSLWTFLGENADVAARVVEHYLLATALYTGLILLLSSRTPRRTTVAILAATVLLAGLLLHGVATGGAVRGGLADAFLLADLPQDTLSPFLTRLRDYQPPSLWEPLPARGTVRLLAAGLLAAGFLLAWRRARSVEVTS